MTAAIIPFDFETNAVRAVMIDDAPWFVAVDVCRVLEHSNIRMAMKRWLDDDEKGVTVCYTLGGKQEMNVVSESGLFALVLRSNTPAARRFRKWVTAELLPTLRKTGRYALATMERDDIARKRERYWSLGQKSRDDAEMRAAAVERVQLLIGQGIKVKEALCVVGAEIGRNRTTINVYRRAVRMVPREDWAFALIHGGGQHGLLHHPDHEAVEYFLDLCKRGHSARESYDMTLRASAGRGWPTLPGLRTMQRLLRRERANCPSRLAAAETAQGLSVITRATGAA